MTKLTTITSPSGARFTVAADYAPKFQALIGDLESAGYGINPKVSGGYNPRNIAGTNKPSNHAFGRAIDINWDRNARGTKGDIPAELARSLAAKHGMTWGGDWKNPDAMHFEVANAGPVPMGQRSLTAFAGVSKTQPPTTGTPQPMPNMLNVGGQAPVMDPAEVARRQQLAKALMEAGQQSAQAPRHWTQALGSILQTGIGSYQAGQAAQGLAQGQQAGNAALAQLLMGGDASAAMANPYSAPDAMKYRQQQQLLNERTAAAERLQRSKIEAQNADPMRQLQMEKLRAETEALKNKGNVDKSRLAQLQQLGIDPNSAEGILFMANGKFPQAVQNQMVQKQQKEQAAPKIAEGLNNLLKMTETYNDPAFENSLGPIQGSQPDGLLSSGWANLARGIGEAWNAVEGGNATPNEVRNNIMGSTEALAAAIKPLIRAPGEGVWTDADQQRLVAVVGDLSQASTKEEFRRRLNAVRDRISSNFALNVPFDAGVANELPKAEPRSTVQPSVSVPVNRGGAGRPVGQAPVQITSDAEYDALPSGTVFIDPKGKPRRKP